MLDRRHQMDLVVVMRPAAQEWEGDKDTLLAGALETDYRVDNSTQQHGTIKSVWGPMPDILKHVSLNTAMACNSW